MLMKVSDEKLNAAVEVLKQRQMTIDALLGLGLGNDDTKEYQKHLQKKLLYLDSQSNRKLLDLLKSMQEEG